jgi:SH3 domain protein
MRHAATSLLILLTLLPAIPAGAETRYVSDQLVINIKDRLESPFTVVAKVRSNEAVNVLEENDNYAKVETEGKQVGWIAKQYLTKTVPKTMIIEQLQTELEALRGKSPQPDGSIAARPDDAAIIKERDRLQLELQAAQGRIAELQAAMAHPENPPSPADSAVLTSEIQGLLEKRSQLESEITGLRAQIESLNDGRIDVDALVRDNEKLQKDNLAKEERIAILTAENEKLVKKTMIYWFCAGALVFLAGMFSGKISGRKKAKYSY